MADLSHVNQTSQTSFNSNHKLYDAARPGYPEDAMELAAELNGGGKILEVAAGTGKFTASLLKFVTASKLTAVEPSGGMLETFREKFPQVATVQAAADKLPFPNDSFSTIYIAQAFHWFATRESLAELHRVLKPEGRLVMIWNYEKVEKLDPQNWQVRTSELFMQHDAGVPQYRHGHWKEALLESSDLFQTPYHIRDFPYQLPLASKQALWDYWTSRSYITALSDDKRAELRREFDKIMQDAPAELVARRGTHIVWLTVKAGSK